MSILTLFLLLVLVVAAHGGAAPIKLCYLFFADQADLGWTFTFNSGRLAVHDALREEYDRPVDSPSYPNVFALPAPKREALITQLATTSGCLVMLTNSDTILYPRHARAYPNVTFVAVPGAQNRTALPANFVYIDFRLSHGFYFMGVAAAMQSRSAVGMLSAFGPPTMAGLSALSFVAGIRDVNATLPVHVLTMASWYNPKAEVLAAKQLIGLLGCDVIGRYSDPFDVDSFVAGEVREGRLAGVMTMGSHTQLQHFVGDTALSSARLAWTAPLLPLLRAVIENGTVGLDDRVVLITEVGADSGLVLDPISPLARPGVAEAVAARRRALNSSYKFCDASTTLLNGSTAPLDDDGCIDHRSLPDYLRFPHTSFHNGTFKSGYDCPVGTSFRYTVTDGLLVRLCEPCTPGTYHPPGTAAAESCAACPNGTTSAPSYGAVQCVAAGVPMDESGSLQTPLIIGGCALAVVAIAAVVGIVFACRTHKALVRDNRAAPTDEAAPFAVVFTDIQSSTALWGSLPQVMGPALDMHHAILRRQIQKHDGYEVKTIGDSFMVAFHTPRQALAFAFGVQEDLEAHDWGTSALEEAYNEFDQCGPLFEINGAASGHSEASVPGTAPPPRMSPVADVPSLTDVHEQSLKGASGATKSEASQAPTGAQADTPSEFQCLKRRWPGLRVRASIHYGRGKITYDETTKGYDYYGTVVNTAARVEGIAHGGQVLLTQAAYDEVRGQVDCDVTPLGAHPLRGLDEPVGLVQCLPHSLSHRRFGPLRLNVEHEYQEELESTQALIQWANPNPLHSASPEPPLLNSDASLFAPVGPSDHPVRVSLKEHSGSGARDHSGAAPVGQDATALPPAALHPAMLPGLVASRGTAASSVASLPPAADQTAAAAVRAPMASAQTSEPGTPKERPLTEDPALPMSLSKAHSDLQRYARDPRLAMLPHILNRRPDADEAQRILALHASVSSLLAPAGPEEKHRIVRAIAAAWRAAPNASLEHRFRGVADAPLELLLLSVASRASAAGRLSRHSRGGARPTNFGQTAASALAVKAAGQKLASVLRKPSPGSTHGPSSNEPPAPPATVTLTPNSLPSTTTIPSSSTTAAAVATLNNPMARRRQQRRPKKPKSNGVLGSASCSAKLELADLDDTGEMTGSEHVGSELGSVADCATDDVFDS